MKIDLIWIGKTKESYLKAGISIYTNRLKHYTDFNIIEINDIKNPKNYSPEQLKVKEGELILAQTKGNPLVLLDEKGKHYNSVKFAEYLEQWQIKSTRKLQFVIGGAFGFSPNVYRAAVGKLALSEMTFSHQMIRLFFSEQLYRGFTIISNQPYHNI
ncbi:UNVERIFIED_CONTAM: hypothetical protein GTU68_035996 [Idotea baltica]|nr:hypothetical protein [Idotea baltica]